jgi:4-carboxymuconolactone decarboxylase
MPSEISEIITHLAFYAGWANAVSAAAMTKEVFARRGVAADHLPSADVTLVPLDEQAEAQRATRVEHQAGTVVPGLVHYTTDVLYRNLGFDRILHHGIEVSSPSAR